MIYPNVIFNREEVATAAPAEATTTEEMDLNTAYQEVLKKALACQGEQ